MDIDDSVEQVFAPENREGKVVGNIEHKIHEGTVIVLRPTENEPGVQEGSGDFTQLGWARSRLFRFFGVNGNII